MTTHIVCHEFCNLHIACIHDNSQKQQLIIKHTSLNKNCSDQIDRFVHDANIAHNAYPSPLNYQNFPKSCCTSINKVISHGIPDTPRLQGGDIINLDITVYLNGYHGDFPEMFVVGRESAADNSARNLL